ncbi:MAG: hypothetical protein WCO18_02130 [bacterium]
MTKILFEQPSLAGQAPANVNFVPQPLDNLIKGILITVGRPNGTQLEIHPTGFVMDLAMNPREREFMLTVEIDPSVKWVEDKEDGPVEQKILGHIVFMIEDSEIAGVCKKRDIRKLTPKVVNGKLRFRVNTTVRGGGDKFFTKSQENYIMVALVTEDGVVHVYEVALPVQDNKLWLYKQNVRNHSAFRDGDHALYPECLFGKRNLWSQLSEWAASVVPAQVIQKLPNKDAWHETEIDYDQIKAGQLLILWSSIRRQQAGGITNDGTEVSVSFHKVIDYPVGKGFNFASQGEIVDYRELRRPQGNSSYLFEAVGVSH